jgi:monoterpene epsilon-lactone hydrolase
MALISAVTPLDKVQRLISTVAREMSTASMSLDANRRALDERGANVPLPDGILIEDIQISDVITGELLTPSCTKKQNVVLYLHGGGFSTGSSISHRPLCAQIARQSQWKVMCVNYRLAPEYKFPCALEDAITSYSWLLSQGYMSADIVFAGDSAGGGLAMAAVQMIMLHKNRQHLPLPAGAIGLSPWLDLECTSESYQENQHIDKFASAQGLRPMGRGYMGDTCSKDPLVSPFYATDLKGMCPLLLQVGSAETLRDEVISFARLAQQDGVDVELQIWENMIHVWHSFGDILPEANMAIRKIADWLDTH